MGEGLTIYTLLPIERDLYIFPRPWWERAG
jgi:hypothetical protein